MRPKEFDLLLILVENAPALVTIDELLDKVWGEIRTEGTVTTTLSRLRAKLETDGEVYIETVAKNGFRCTSPVTRETASVKPASRLPKRLSLFIGRGREIAELERLISAFSLVTLTGSGGIGKTRLAIETAAALEDRYSGAVWFASLAEIMDADLILPVIASALGLRGMSPDRLKEETAKLLSQQRSLLVLDNFEQVADLGANAVKELLERAAGLTCLVTSRRPLNLDGERVFPVSPLNVIESVQLFLDRAQSVNPAFEISGENGGQIQAICEKLEGIPLAIEIAASRARTLSPAEILKGLERRFKFLVSNRRDVSDRHRTLQTAIDWSHQLLTPELRQFFSRLSIFRGGCTMEAANLVCDEDPELDSLTSLEEWSLVRAEFVSNHTRYRMSEALREFGYEQLSEEEREALAQKHAGHFFSLAETAHGKIGAEDNAWLDRLEFEHDNLRAALDYYGKRESDAEQELKLAVFLGHFWETHGYWTEGRDRLQQALTRQQLGTSLLKAQGLGWLGFLSLRLDDYDRARQALTESIEMSRGINDREAKECLGFALISLGFVAEAQGHYQEAKSIFLESLKPSQEVKVDWMIARAFRGIGLVAEIEGDFATAKEYYEKYLSKSEEIHDTPGIAAALNCLGLVHREQGDYSHARDFHQRSLALRQGLGSKGGIAICLFNLGLVEEETGQHQTAYGYFQQSLALRQEIGDKRGIAKSLEGIGRMAVAMGREEDASRIFGAADTVRTSAGASMSPTEQKRYGALMLDVRKKFPQEWNEGSQKVLAEVIIV
ncbi:MAG TPA: tetratricopeptide repeat protein [Blastocatellia bacterium]|nr:tetratricopeptide repeat protein [Blastocatellia bacterium]